jgi:hypothetical protein
MAHSKRNRAATSLSIATILVSLGLTQLNAVAQMPAENPEINPGDTLVIIGGTVIDGDGTGGTGTIVGPPGTTVGTPTPTPTATPTYTPTPFDTPVNTPTPVPGSYIILPPTSDQCLYGGTWTCGVFSECCVDTNGQPLACCVSGGL